MLVSPTEPPPLRRLGTVSLVPEQYGADVLIPSRAYGLVGVQRKEYGDMVASVQDGRLQKELAQMSSLGQGILLVEGKPRWTDDGLLMSRSSWTISQHRGTMWSVLSRGYWIDSTESLAGTCDWILAFTEWLARAATIAGGVRAGLSHRPNGVAKWGHKSSRDWSIHFLQGLEGVGPELAARIFDEFGVPLAWTVTAEDLMRLPGVGKKKAEKILNALVEAGPS